METFARVLRTSTALVNRVLLAGLAALLAWDTLVAAPADALPLTERALAWAAAHPTEVGIAALVLLLLELDVVGFAAYCLLRAPGKAYFVSRTEGGSTRVALGAVERALQATIRHVPHVARAKVRVRRTGRRRYRIHVRYRVDDVARAGQAADHLRELLRRRLSELVVLGPKERVDLDLDLEGLEKAALEGGPPRRLPRPSDASEPGQFRGPVYEAEGEVAG